MALVAYIKPRSARHFINASFKIEEICMELRLLCCILALSFLSLPVLITPLK